MEPENFLRAGQMPV